VKHEELETFNNISYKGLLSQVIKVLKMLILASLSSTDINKYTK